MEWLSNNVTIATSLSVCARGRLAYSYYTYVPVHLYSKNSYIVFKFCLLLCSVYTILILHVSVVLCAALVLPYAARNLAAEIILLFVLALLDAIRLFLGEYAAVHPAGEETSEQFLLCSKNSTFLNFLL